jgi:hypothetical protein
MFLCSKCGVLDSPITGRLRESRRGEPFRERECVQGEPFRERESAFAQATLSAKAGGRTLDTLSLSLSTRGALGRPPLAELASAEGQTPSCKCRVEGRLAETLSAKREREREWRGDWRRRSRETPQQRSLLLCWSLLLRGEEFTPSLLLSSANVDSSRQMSTS